jgi:hypothetical protein
MSQNAIPVVVPATTHAPGNRSSRRRATSGWRYARRDDTARDSRDERDKRPKKATLVLRVQAMTGRKLALICRVLGIGRASANRDNRSRGRRYTKADDRVVTAQIRDVRTRAMHGSRRTRALVNRAFATGYNLKRIRLVMELAEFSAPPRTSAGAVMYWRSRAGFS